MKIFSSFLLPLTTDISFWYPFSINSKVNLKEQRFFEKDYCVYRLNSTSSPVIQINSCPHQSAKLSKGKIVNDCIMCPYHGFKFDDRGCFRGIQHHNENHNENTKNKLRPKKVFLQTFPCVEDDNLIYISHSNDDASSVVSPSTSPTNAAPRVDIYYPEEKFDASFRVISGHRKINTNYRLICENLLDMMHISWVHSFGRESSLPFKIKYREINDYHGETTFLYEPSKASLSSIFNQKSKHTASTDSADSVVTKVTNAFILPTNTLTRVEFGMYTKTVFTRTIPVDEHNSILYWELYRNFLTGNPILDCVGDVILHYLMEKTIDEDVAILKHVNFDKHSHMSSVVGNKNDKNDKNDKNTIKTNYDITILHFRQACEKLKNESNKKK